MTQAQKPIKLVDLAIKEVSGVDAAANMRKFLVVKNATPGNTLKDKLLNIVKAYLPPKNGSAMTFTQAYAYETLDSQLSDMMYDAGWALRDTIKSIMADNTVTDKIGAINAALGEFSQVVSGAFENALNTVGSVAATGITKSKEGNKMSAINEEVLKTLPEDVQKSIKGLIEKAAQANDLQKQVDDLQKQIDGLKKSAGSSSNDNPNGTEVPEEVLKSMPESVRNLVIKSQEEAREAAKRAQQAEEIAKQERDLRVTKEFVAKAATLNHLGINAETFGPVLKAVSEKCPEQYETIFKTLEAANHAVETGEILKEYGGNGDQPTSAWDEIQKKADELRKSETNLTKEQAIQEVMKREPKLYQRYLKEDQ